MGQYVYLLTGSNKGNREKHLLQAIELLNSQVGTVDKVSGIYRTAAWGDNDQDDFLNQALGLTTDLSPEELLRAVKQIEQQMGRTLTRRWGPREIDIDIALYGNLIFHNEQLEIPHIGLPDRRFALRPLMDIAADVLHPVLGITIAEMLEKCTDTLEVTPHEV